MLQALESDPTSIDAVVRMTGLPVQRVLSTISVLEMRRLVEAEVHQDYLEAKATVT